MRKAFGDVAISSLPSELRTLWYTRHDELEKEYFISLPYWMPTEPSEPSESPQSRDLEMVVAYLLTTVTEREAFILVRRFWFEDTFEEIAELMEVTRERVRQIECRALRKLRHPSRAALYRLVVDLPDHYGGVWGRWLDKVGHKVPDDFIEWIRKNTKKSVDRL